jgi:hypothetical protein
MARPATKHLTTEDFRFLYYILLIMDVNINLRVGLYSAHAPFFHTLPTFWNLNSFCREIRGETWYMSSAKIF